MTEPLLISDARPRHIAKRRSLHTNNPHRLEGLDGRTSHGRRFRDLTDELAGEFGHASASALRELAGIRLAIEVATAAAIGGDGRARQDTVRLSNLAARKERDLREAKQAAAESKPADSLEQHLARRSAEKAAAG
jgi:hypothetical protein